MLEVAYADRAALRHDAETQLARGGLFVAVDAAALPPFAELTLRLVVDDVVLEAPVRLTVATAQAACVEIAGDARAQLLAEVAAHTADVEARAGDKRVRFADPAEAGARENADAGGEDAGAEEPGAESRVDEPPGAEGAPARAADTRGQLSLDRRVAAMSVSEKVQLALHGQRDARQLLLRERAGVVQASLVRNPKMTLDEVQMLARSPQLSPETADVLAQHPSWGSSPQIAMALVRNPRTPITVATALVAKLQPNDLRTVAKGLGVRMQVAAAARKRLNEPSR
ncbi:MAG: hypothetical protein JWN44_2609 [Myxococcales bacterium]|nr:hypothetical protein [Myxococcales bacterium]